MDNFEPALIVENYMIAGEYFDNLYLRESISAKEYYETINTDLPPYKYVSGADITIQYDFVILTLVERIDVNGRYSTAVEDQFIVEPGVNYALTVQFKDYELHSNTTVPDNINISIEYPVNSDIIEVEDSVVVFVQTDNIYGLMIIVDEDDNYIPDFWGDDLIIRSYSPTLRRFLTIENEIIIPKNYFRYYQAKTWIIIYNLDQNLFDYYSSSFDSGFDPIPRINHIKGGLGIFGSMSVDSVHVSVAKSDK